MHPSNYSYVTGMYLYGVLVNSNLSICLQVFHGSSVKIPLKDSSLKETGTTIVDRHALEPTIVIEKNFSPSVYKDRRKAVVDCKFRGGLSVLVGILPFAVISIQI